MEVRLSQAQRTTISFLLFVHLFALAVAIASNTSPPDLERQGPQVDLKRQLRQTPGVVPYLRVLNMDLAYGAGDAYQSGNYHLTHGGAMDVNHTIEIEPSDTDGATGSAWLPPDGVQPWLRRLHYQRLAEKLARLADNDVAQSRLSQAVASHYLAANEAERVTLRGRGRFLPSIADMEAGRTAVGEERGDVLVEYQAWTSGDDVLVQKLESAAESAPAALSTEQTIPLPVLPSSP